MTASPLSLSDKGLRLSLKVTPKASRDKIGSVVPDASGVASLQVFVTSVPEDGRANQAVIRLLSKRWRVAKSAFLIVKGATDRYKILEISSDEPEALYARLSEEISKLGS